ncbi:conjugal transfer protein TraF [Campylobacter sp. W0014]|uniref:TlpA family protein disulfide reductase n=1 Tax=Campylobacter sp. W0014 TaxID=2735781 RepID=UPI001ED2B749|nr:conjugal transfer protein TraF [Campylobacter sp. W0014]
MEKFKVQAYFIALIAVLFFIACSDGENFKSLDHKNYNFSYNGFEKTLKLNQKDENFALVFFTKDCGVCKEQIKILQQLIQNYNFNVFVILGDAKNLDDAKNWAKEKGLTQLTLFYEKNAAKYLSDSIGGIYGVPVISFFESGKMNKKFIGLTPYHILENEVKRIKN